MKKTLVRAAVLAVFTAGLGTTAAIVGTGTAMACEAPSESSYAFAATLPQVNYGDHNEHVLGLQLSLRFVGYNYLQGTGTYSDNTLAAVKDFQRKHGINDSGIVGSKTWAALVGPKSAIGTGNGKATPPPFSLNPGDSDSDKVFYLVNVLQRIHPYWEQSPYSEVYDARLQGMVQDFQRRVGINPSGIIGPKTWAAFYKVVSVSGTWGC